MKTRLTKLIHDASDSATWRGHMIRWIERNETTAQAVCDLCGMTIAINTNPMPDGIGISGEAVALNCKGGGNRYRERR